jgi:hypothetical protein
MTNEERQIKINAYINKLIRSSGILRAYTHTIERSLEQINEMSDGIEAELNDIVSLCPDVDVEAIKEAMAEMTDSMPNDYTLDEGLDRELNALAEQLRVKAIPEFRIEPGPEDRNIDVAGDLDPKKEL